MELNENANGQTAQVDQEKLFEQFYNSDSHDIDSVLAKTPAPEAAASEAVVAGTPDTQAPSGEGVVAVEQEAERNEVAATDAPPSQPDPNSWLTQLPEDVRKNVEQLAKQAQLWQERHQEQASKNRKLHNEVERLKKTVEVPKAPAAPAPEADDVWDQLKQADPVLVAALEKKFKALEGRAAQEAEHKVQERFQPIEQAQREQFIQEQLQTLDSYVPNWREVAQDPMYQSWFDAQTPGTKALYNSLYATDTVRLLKLYADDMERYFGQQPVAPAAPAPSSNPQVSHIDKQRQEKLAKSAPVPTSGVGVAKQAALSQDQLFSKFYDDPDTILALIAKQNRS